MWQPRTWSDLLAARGVIAEAPDRDFKAQMTSNREIAKDIAAMTIQGGLIAYGIEEDDQAVAKEITPIELSHVPEQVQQIADTAIWPTPAIALSVIADPDDAAQGVVIVTVPPSPLAPHYANDRYPARSGTTTRYLAEREIAAMYEQRRVAFSALGETEILSGHLDPIGAPPGFRGLGVLRMMVTPVAPTPHPKGVYLGRPLTDAVRAAQESLAWLSHAPPSAFDFLSRGWTPRGTVGWQAGETSGDFETLRGTATAAAVCTHDLAFSFFSTLGLEGEDRAGFCAFEHLWAAQTLAFLSVAGHFFREVPGASILRVDLSLQGLDGAVSFAVSHGRVFNENQLHAVDRNYHERTQTNPREAADLPIEVARRLLDRLWVSFVPQEADVFVRLRSG